LSCLYVAPVGNAPVAGAVLGVQDVPGSTWIVWQAGFGESPLYGQSTFLPAGSDGVFKG
jgi:hypothetical protein